ncbi:MAG: IS200/IS605 family transposase [Planctomycetaceae bacterium]|nr:IS200/IS605 family transposase [Planctomycetaceae bacterium]
MSTYSRLLVHVVFSTKERHPWITDDLRSELHAYLGGIARNIDATPIVIGGVADHVHALIALPTKLSVADLVRTLKSNSSGWVHEKWPERLFQWQNGYGAFSVSESSKDTVVRYIENQAEHHRVRSFQEEFLELLNRHCIEFDPRYVWD